MTKLRQVCAAAALAATASGAAVADTTASVGIMSDYIWRGIYTSDASAFASIDLETDSGFYLGAWGADVGNGLEYDVYLGYTGGTDNFTWNVGFTGYYFTDEADDTYQELNLGISVGFLDLQYALGDYNNQLGVIPENPPGSGFPINRSRDQTYQYLIATFQPDVGPYYLIGRGDYQNIPNIGPTGQMPSAPGSTINGKDGMWVEIGKDFEIMDGLEIGVSAIYTPDAANPGDDFSTRSVFLSSSNPFAEYAMVMHITKTINIGD